jgi:hypothetical protein
MCERVRDRGLLPALFAISLDGDPKCGSHRQGHASYIALTTAYAAGSLTIRKCRRAKHPRTSQLLPLLRIANARYFSALPTGYLGELRSHSKPSARSWCSWSSEADVAKGLIAEKDAELERLRDPDVMLKVKAAKMRGAHPNLTPEQAYALAVDQNPELYEALVNKRRSAVMGDGVAKHKCGAPETLLSAKAVEIRKSAPNLTEAQAYT